MKVLRVFLLGAIVFFSACNSEQKKDDVQDTLMEEVDSTTNQPLKDTLNTETSNTTANSANNPNSILVSCDAVGKINIGDTYEDVIRKAGKANVKLDSVMVNGVFQNAYATKVWKGTAGELTINWQESEQPYQTIQNIIIDQPNASYVLENGIKIGSPLSLLNKLNGNPISLIGFKGKYSGTMINFNEGNLRSQIPCVRGVFQLPKMKSYPKEVNAVLTENMVQSTNVAFKIYDPILVKLIINSKR